MSVTATKSDPAHFVGIVPESRLVRLMRTWEWLGSWNEQELFLQFGDDLCSLGRYITARTFHERVYPADGPEAMVVAPRDHYQRLKEAATWARNEAGAESRVGLIEGDLD
jgi:hypothetical protein